MLTVNCLRKIAGVLLLLFGLGAAGLQARTRKGDKLIAQSRAAEVRKQWDEALSLAEQALSEDPADIAYQLTTTRLRFYDAQYHIDQGKRLRQEGKLDQALAEFQKAYGVNPASSLAEEEIGQTKRMIEREKKKTPAEQNPEQRGMTPGELERQREEKRFAAMRPLPELKPLNPAPINLKMNNQTTRVLFETVGKLAGINVLFDPQPPAQSAGSKQSIELNNATLDEALDYLALITHSFWKPISANAIFVTEDNPTKRREYEDWVVKVFYLKNVTTQQEIQEIVTAIRTVVELQKIFQYQAQNAVIVRGEADKVALAEKMIADLDKPKPEVQVDILVMQLSSDAKRNLAAAIAPSGLNQTIAFTPRASIASPAASTTAADQASTAAATATSIPLSNIARISTRDYSLTLPGGLLQAVLTDANSKVLQAPSVRAIDNQKVQLNIGQKVPYATGSFQPGIGGVGINPLVNTQFTFLDVGVNVTVVPKIHGADEVSLDVDVEISNVTGTVPLGGIDEPELAQTKVHNSVRLKQGEVNLMGGLMQVEEDKSVSGVPGLGNIPVLRRLFTSETVHKTASELVIALIPHIVRAPEISDVNLKTIAAGNQTVVKLNYAPEQPAAAPQPPASAPAPQPVPGQAPTVPGAPSPLGPTAPPQPGVPGQVPPLAPPATAPPAPAAKPQGEALSVPPGTAANQPKVAFVPIKVSTELNKTITVSLMVDNAADLAAAPMQIRFDPKILRLNDIVRGNLLAGDGQQVAFSKNVMNDSGEASVDISRAANLGGVSGSGSIVTLVFQAIGRGDTIVAVPQLTLRNSQSQTILTAAPQLSVSVR